MSDNGWTREQMSIEEDAVERCKTLLYKYGVKVDDPTDIDCEEECPAYNECMGGI